MLKIMRITGDSLSPEFEAGDFVLVAKIAWLIKRLRPGDLVVLRHPDYGVLIKRVAAVQAEAGTLTVIGSHPDSVDSRRFGAVAMERVEGRVIWHVRRPSPPAPLPRGGRGAGGEANNYAED